MIFLAIIAVVIIISNSSKKQAKDSPIQIAFNKLSEKSGILPDLGFFPVCPDNLDGILTAQLMDPQYISGLIPLGNINPPGHTSPVDHIYFDTMYEGRIPLYAPADAWITHVTEILYQDDTGNYISSDFGLTYTLCKGLVLDLAGYTGISSRLREKLDEVRSECVYGINKIGHDKVEGQCHYNVTIPVVSGEELGYTQAEMKDNRLTLPLEVWAANYNVPARADVNWDFYNDDRYAHIMCLFDLYSGDLKDQYYQKFGYYDTKHKKEQANQEPEFIARTIEPRCGQVNQDLTGTIQGMWYAGKPGERNLESQGKGLAFLHNNIDPTMAEISIGGTIMDPLAVLFQPRHSGFVDREPSEVTADGNIYCFNTRDDKGKVLVQLMDDHHMKVENQDGACTDLEEFNIAYDYMR
ncbi:MAG: hypothetical protein C0391_09355 [Anaerolinea sp.]|nr:hypothetical protein [Anaerolinea sp.]